jgi:hypothetical protein
LAHRINKLKTSFVRYTRPKPWKTILTTLTRSCAPMCMGAAVAAFTGQMSSVRSLVGHGAQVNSVDVMGSTPLHLAALALRKDVVVTLVRTCGNATPKTHHKTWFLVFCARSSCDPRPGCQAFSAVIPTVIDASYIHMSWALPVFCFPSSPGRI